MKPFFFVVALFGLFYTSAQAQATEFAPEGSVWKYRRLAGGWGPPVIDTVEVRYKEDIWVDTILCKRLVAPEGDYYVYQVGDRVYHRRDTATLFKLLWDFGVMPGDSFFVYSNSEYAPGREIKFVCTGRDTILENNLPLPRIDLTMYCGGPWVQSITVNPRYGPMYNGHCPGYLFSTYNYCVVDAGYGFTLLHYSDNAFPSVNNCITSTAEANSLLHTKAVPNPTTGWFQLTNLPHDAVVHCYDMLGRLVVTPNDAVGSIDLSFCQKGMYIIEIQTNSRKFEKIKVVKI